MDDPKNPSQLAERLAETKEWLGEKDTLDLVIIYNNMALNMEYYDKRKMEKKSEVISYQWRPDSPQYINAKI